MPIFQAMAECLEATNGGVFSSSIWLWRSKLEYGSVATAAWAGGYANAF
jgi:hypothetical protein